jgi:hypothetical protein
MGQIAMMGEDSKSGSLFPTFQALCVPNMAKVTELKSLTGLKKLSSKLTYPTWMTR